MILASAARLFTLTFKKTLILKTSLVYLLEMGKTRKYEEDLYSIQLIVASSLQSQKTQGMWNH